MISFLKKHLVKFKYAFAGLLHGLFRDKSIALQALIGICVLIVCLFLSLSIVEWICICIMILLVLAVEFINSAIEHIVDFISPQYHKQAKIIKDYAAAAVLLISMIAALVGLYIIGGHLF